MIDYKEFIEENFRIKTKKGEIVPFIFNDTQNFYYNLLLKDYPEFEGIRENLLKFRQWGGSSLIDGIFAADFIFAEQAHIPLIDADIVSHKDKETLVLFNRFNFFIDSFLEKNNVVRKDFLDIDSVGHLKSKRGAEAWVQTANARVSGRGGTKQNIHWSETGFYPNTDILSAEELVLAAEQQVADGVGKIFRESTGNISGDFFSTEYEMGKLGEGEFKSRFLSWWIHKEYSRETPIDWPTPLIYKKLIKDYGVTREQCYWHFKKMQTAKDKKKIRREYPMDDTEAFLMSGELYFDSEAIIHYGDMLKKPLKEDLVYVQTV